jgi:YD repeat-containing protein
VGQLVCSEKLTNVVINDLTNSFVPESTLVSIGAVLATNSSSFDAAGRLLATTNALGRITRYEYDKAGRKTAVIDTLMNRTDYAYDAAGRLIATTNALGRVTRYEFDAIGRQVRTIFPDATYTGTAYNELGQRLRETNQLGLVTDFEYNTNGRLSAIVKPAVLNPEGGTNARPRYEFEYDSASQLALVRDAKGRVTSFAHDQLGRLLGRTLPLNQSANQSYNSSGQLYRKTDFKGQIAELLYDEFGRPETNNFYAAGSTNVGKTVASVYDAKGRIYQVVDPRGTTQYDYDSASRLTRLALPEGVLNYEYDPVTGQRTRVYSTNSDLRYTYNELGKLRTTTVIMRDRVTLPTPEVTTNTYTALDSLQNVYWPNGNRTDYQYDSMNRLTNVTHVNSASTVLASYGYMLSASGQRTNVTETRLESAGTNSTTQIGYTFDDLGRLIREASTSQLAEARYTNTYVYDLVGNRLTNIFVAGGVTEIISFTYNANDQLLQEASAVNGTFTNKYDANGSLTNRSSAAQANAYFYNLENRLAYARISRSESGHTVAITNSYIYDPSGLRVRTDATNSIDGAALTTQTRLFLVEPNNPSGYGQVLEELSAVNGLPTASYSLGTRVLTQTKSGKEEGSETTIVIGSDNVEPAMRLDIVLTENAIADFERSPAEYFEDEQVCVIGVIQAVAGNLQIVINESEDIILLG